MSNGGSINIRGLSPVLSFDTTGAGIPKILMDGKGVEFKDGTLDAEGSVAVKIDSSGRVGIGTSSPTSRLTVASGTDLTNAGDGIHFFGSSINNQAAIQSFNTGAYDGDLRFYTSDHGSPSTSIGSERMRLFANGNLSIGTTSSLGKLTVSNNGAEGIEFFPANITGGNTTQHYNRSGSAYLINNVIASEHRFNNGGTERMRISSAGKVGIGTTSPSAKLTIETANEGLYDVLGVHNGITGTSALGKGAAIRIGSGSNGNYSTKIATIYEGNNPGYLQPALAFFTMNNTYLKDSETEKMRISANGNVGIGVISPTVPLHVGGTISQTSGSMLAFGNVEAGLGHVKSSQGYLVGTTTVIDSNRNLTNIGTISATGDLLIDSANAEINLKSGITGTSGAINWTYNTTGTNYASIKLPYDTRASTGLHIDSGYPITIDSTTSTLFAISGTNKGTWDTNGLTVVNTVSAASYDIGTTTVIDSSRNISAGTITTTGNITIPSKVVHNGDSNTYIQFHAADQWRVVTGGVERLEVNNSQTTVAGTFQAQQIKHGNSVPTTLQFDPGGGQGSFWISMGASDKSFAVSDGNASRFVVGGTVGGVTGSGIIESRRQHKFNPSVATTSDATATIISKGTVDTTTGYQPQNWHMAFQDGGGTVRGKITSSHYSTQYSTSSDYRLKEDIQPIANATARLLAIEAVNFRWIDGQQRSDGFIAHELQEHLPEAVTGTKDATEEVTETVVAEDGTESEVTRTIDALQGVDQSKLVPLLVKTIQELEARITALENA